MQHKMVVLTGVFFCFFLLQGLIFNKWDQKSSKELLFLYFYSIVLIGPVMLLHSGLPIG